MNPEWPVQSTKLVEPQILGKSEGMPNQDPATDPSSEMAFQETIASLRNVRFDPRQHLASGSFTVDSQLIPGRRVVRRVRQSRPGEESVFTTTLGRYVRFANQADLEQYDEMLRTSPEVQSILTNLNLEREKFIQDSVAYKLLTVATGTNLEVDREKSVERFFTDVERQAYGDAIPDERSQFVELIHLLKAKILSGEVIDDTELDHFNSIISAEKPISSSIMRKRQADYGTDGHENYMGWGGSYLQGFDATIKKRLSESNEPVYSLRWDGQMKQGRWTELTLDGDGARLSFDSATGKPSSYIYSVYADAAIEQDMKREGDSGEN